MTIKFKQLFNLFAVKITLGMIVVVSATFLTSGYIEYQNQKQLEKEKIQLQIDFLESRLDNTTSFILWNLDFNILTSFINTEVKYSEIAYIKITSSNGDTIEAGTNLQDNVIETNKDLFFEGFNLGSVYFQVDTKPSKERLSFFLMKLIITALIEVLLLSLVCILIIRFYVTSPLSQLEKSMKSISQDSELTKIKVKGKYDEVSRVSILFNNIVTKIQTLLEEKSEKNKELNQTLTQLTNTQDQLVKSEKMASLGSLVAGVAHEINTPVGIGVTASTSALEKIKELKDQFNARTLKGSSFNKYVDSIQECNELIYSNLDRVGNLISSFKQLAVDQEIEDKRQINLFSYLEDLLLSIKPAFKTKTFVFINDVDPQINLTTQPGLFTQIFTNLLMNAGIHAFENIENGQIKISAQYSKNKCIQISINDNGVGMDESLIATVFDPFVTTKRNNGGTGLGGNIVFNIVTQKLNGTIKCHSKIAEGTTFIIEVPL